MTSRADVARLIEHLDPQLSTTIHVGSVDATIIAIPTRIYAIQISSEGAVSGNIRDGTTDRIDFDFAAGGAGAQAINFAPPQGHALFATDVNLDIDAAVIVHITIWHRPA